MRRLYRVKPSAAEALKLSQGLTIVDGYLAVSGVIQNYSLAQANKKCYMFDGVKELYKTPLLEAISEVTMTQIAENALNRSIVKALRGREAFVDADINNTENIYYGCVFNDILVENDGTGAIVLQTTLDQLELLASLIHTDYVQIVKP